MKKLIGSLASTVAMFGLVMALTGCCCERDCCEPCPRPCAPKPYCPKPCPPRCCAPQYCPAPCPAPCGDTCGY